MTFQIGNAPCSWGVEFANDPRNPSWQTVLKECAAELGTVGFMKRHMGRISYMHFKDIDPKVKADAIANRTDFYEACGKGTFCNLGKGDVDFPAVRRLLIDSGSSGWCTVEQDCDPALAVAPIDDARANRAYLQSIGFN